MPFDITESSEAANSGENLTYRQEVLWNKTYGEKNNEEASAVLQTTDGGYILVGRTDGLGVDYRGIVVKTDINGLEQWTKNYLGFIRALIQTPDGGYAFVGEKWSFDFFYFSKNDMWLIKTDSNGAVEWNQSYGGNFNEAAYGLIQSADGGYILAGYTDSYGAGEKDMWLIKTDANGTLQWDQSYGGNMNEEAFGLIQTVDGGYALAGYTESYGNGKKDVWLIKTDVNGTIQWNQTYGGTENEEVYTLVQTVDGDFLLAGYTESYGVGEEDIWLVKTDQSGARHWDKTFGSYWSDKAQALIQTTDGNFALAGSIYWDPRCEHPCHFNMFLAKIDITGNEQWNQSYGGVNGDKAYGLLQTSDENFLLAGYTESYGAGGWDMWLVKTIKRRYEETTTTTSWDTAEIGIFPSLIASVILIKLYKRRKQTKRIVGYH